MTEHPVTDPSYAEEQLAHVRGISVAELRNQETIVTDPKTGGMKGTKPCQLGAIDPLALKQLGLVAGMGAAKYQRGNFLLGYAWSLSFDALMRHLLAFWDGEEHDPESGLPHLAHAAFHCLALISFSQRGLGTDDRFKFDSE